MRPGDREQTGVVLPFGLPRSRFWMRTGFSAEAVYWLLYALGVSVLLLLIVQILNGQGG